MTDGLIRLCLCLCMSMAGVAAQAADEPHGFPLTVVVFKDSPWQMEQVRAALTAADALLQRECGVSLPVKRIVRLQVPQALRPLRESDEDALIKSLNYSGPFLFFTWEVAGSRNAYSYLESYPIARAGSSWVTPGVPKQCLHKLIVHELGHVILGEAGHSQDPDNFLYPQCSASNIQGYRSNFRINKQQCAVLRQRLSP